MNKLFKKTCAVALSCAMVVTSVTLPGNTTQVDAAGIVDEFSIPSANANGVIGATVPYTRYDSEEATIGGGASIAKSLDFDATNIASQASNQSYVKLPSSGSYAEWKMTTTGDGVTMRFTMPDSSDGTGLKGSVDVYVNGTKQKTVNLDSYWMWQYFSYGSGSPSDTPNGSIGSFAFDEVHFMLDKSLKEGDTIRIQSSGANGLEYGIDFLEIEQVEEEIEQPANSVSVEDYGAYPDDGIDDLNAFRNAVKAADAAGMDVYIPAGEFTLSGMWNIGCSDMKITGAGMWYTKLQFTSAEAFGGGISGGNPNAGDGSTADGYCKNLEFCNMYINSGLRSRYHEQAVYKCFMDIFDNSVIHDVWEEHFECGFWFGDYNGATDYCDNSKIIDCRIRNNLADGVNFCQGTSNATVYNCNIRNTGDDGLAMWNNSYGNAKDESNNKFCYNTIDFVWRAGAIAIYGGNGHKIYNNYIRDTFMSAGIHLNTTFPGYAFANNTSGITFDNNIIISSGCGKDCWSEELGGVDIKGNVSNVTFNNTYIYDSQHEGIRLMTGYSNVKFNNTYIFGTGMDGATANYSSIPHLGAAIRFQQTGAVFNGLEIANVAYKGTTAPYFFDGDADTSSLSNVNIYEEGSTYDVPDYPDPDNPNPPGPINNVYTQAKGCDLQVTGLRWENESGSTSLTSGNKTTFKVAVKNSSSIDIPETAKIQVKVTIDGKGSYTATYDGGLAANKSKLIEISSKWTATAGGHTIAATVDYGDKFEESSEDNNVRTKDINVADAGVNKAYTKVTGGYDLYVTDITYNKSTIATGDQLVFTAHVVNAGDAAIPSGKTIGVQFQIDGSTSVITWCDTFDGGLAPGESVELTANGGTNGNTWTAIEGTHTVTAWVDDVDRITGEVDETNNKSTITLTIPYGGISYKPSTDAPDNLDDIDNIVDDPTSPIETSNPTTVAPTTQKQTTSEQNQETQKETTSQPTATEDYTKVTGGYDLFVTGITFTPASINVGTNVVFSATVVNAGDTAIPAGTTIGAQFQIDGGTSVITWSDTFDSGLAPGEKVVLTANGGTNGNSWTAVNGAHTVTAWVDDVNRLPNEVNENNNKTTISLTIPHVAAESTTKAQTTAAPTTTKANANAPAAVTGLTNAPAADGTLPYYFAWGASSGATSYNFYINNVLVGSSTVEAYNAESYFATANAGTYIIGVTAVNEGGESPATTISFTKKGEAASTEKVTEAPTAAPTQAPTEAPTVAPTQAPTVAPTVAPTEAPSYEDDIILNGDENGQSSMIGTYQIPQGYKYLGFVTLKDATSAHKYLTINYTGNISTVRFEFAYVDASGNASNKVGPYWFNSEGQTKYFVTPSGNAVSLNSGTLTIDLEKSGIDLTKVNSLYMHSGDDNVEATTLNITLAKLSTKYSGATETTQKATEAPTQAPTEAPTQAPTQAPTVAPTKDPTTSVNVEAPAAVTGLTNAPAADGSLPYYFAWGTSNGATSYNFYINNVLIGSSTVEAYNAESYFATANAGTYTIGVTAVNAGGESPITTISFTKKGEAASTEKTTEATTEVPSYEDDIILNGDENGKSAMIGTYEIPQGYKYLGFVTLKDVTADYKYLTINYTGNISTVRFEFAYVDESGNESNKVGPYWFNSEGQTKYFVTPSGNALSLNDGTLTIDLEKSGIDLTKVNSVHMHSGDGNVEATTLNITMARLSTKYSGATETTQKATEAPTEAPTVAPTQTPTQAPTLAPTEAPTVAPTTKDNATTKTTTVQNENKSNVQITVAKVKVKSATKKKSAKKLVLKVNKISGAKGYQVKVYKTSKNAKKNKKAILTKTIKKNTAKLTVSSKKLKKQKKLYVRVRAYKLDGKSKKYGAWSKVKKAKIK